MAGGASPVTSISIAGVIDVKGLMDYLVMIGSKCDLSVNLKGLF